MSCLIQRTGFPSNQPINYSVSNILLKNSQKNNRLSKNMDNNPSPHLSSKNEGEEEDSVTVTVLGPTAPIYTYNIPLLPPAHIYPSEEVKNNSEATKTTDKKYGPLKPQGYLAHEPHRALNQGYLAHEPQKILNQGYMVNEPQKTSNIGYLAHEPHKTSNQGYELRKNLNQGYLAGDPQKFTKKGQLVNEVFKPVHIKEEVIEENESYGGATDQFKILPFIQGSNIIKAVNEVFNLKLEIEQRDGNLGGKFNNFRIPHSPPLSSPSSSSQISLFSLGGSSPLRRHSFSASLSNSMSCLNNCTCISCTSPPATLTFYPPSSSPSSSAYYRQRSHTYSNASSKSHPYAYSRRILGGGRELSHSSEGVVVDGIRIRPLSSMSDDLHKLGDEGSQGQDEKNEEIQTTTPSTPDPASFLFLGPVGKKRRMVREREKSGESIGGDEVVSPDEYLTDEISPSSNPVYETQTSLVNITSIRDIVEEDEGQEGSSTEPLNLCLQRVKSLNISSTPSSSTKTTRSQGASVLRKQLLGVGPSSAPVSHAAGMEIREIEMEKGPAKSALAKKKLKCEDCGKEFSQLRNFRYHRSRHEGTTQFSCVCPVCHKQFNDKGYLSSHLKIHRNAKEYQCEWCEKSFNQRVAYNMHVRIHTGLKPHQCTMCTKAFSRKMLLRQHLRTHTGERPYSCEICGKSFADRSNMLLHQRLHSGQRPYQCPQCGKSFSKNHHLKTHLNHHAGIKPYQCDKCKACFSQSSNMKTHYRKCSGVSNVPLSVAIASITSSGPHSSGLMSSSSSTSTHAQNSPLLHSSAHHGASSTGGHLVPVHHANTQFYEEGRRGSRTIVFGGSSSEGAPPYEVHSEEEHSAAASVLSLNPTVNYISTRHSSGSSLTPHLPQIPLRSFSHEPISNKSKFNIGLPPTPSTSSLQLNFELNTLRSTQHRFGEGDTGRNLGFLGTERQKIGFLDKERQFFEKERQKGMQAARFLENERINKDILEEEEQSRIFIENERHNREFLEQERQKNEFLEQQERQKSEYYEKERQKSEFLEQERQKKSELFLAKERQSQSREFLDEDEKNREEEMRRRAYSFEQTWTAALPKFSPREKEPPPPDPPKDQ